MIWGNCWMWLRVVFMLFENILHVLGRWYSTKSIKSLSGTFYKVRFNGSAKVHHASALYNPLFFEAQKLFKEMSFQKPEKTATQPMWLNSHLKLQPQNMRSVIHSFRFRKFAFGANFLIQARLKFFPIGVCFAAKLLQCFSVVKRRERKKFQN